MLKVYLILVLAIAAEVVGTTALAASQQFTRLGPSLIVVAGYSVSFYLLSMTLTVLPVGVVYALWSGLGVMGVALIGTLVLGQRLDPPALIGIALIVTGVIVINVFSKATLH